MTGLKKHAILLLALLLVVSSLSCGKKKEVEFLAVEDNLQHTIYITSDLHLLANSLVKEGTKKEQYTNDGRVQAKDYELVRALIDKVNQDKPEALILTGDLSYNGELESHKELVKMLNTIDKSVKVLVIPGNHDTYILNGLVADCSTTYESFRKLYADYGYTGAVSYDTDTLSYAYQLSDDFLALMIDTTLNIYNVEENRNVIGGSIGYDTMLWMEEQLIRAREKGQRVVCFTHHNVVDHDTGFKSGYTLIDNENVIELLMKYDVQLNFSGHLHIQNIARATENGKTLYDIASSSLLTYGNAVGKLNIYSDGFTYSRDNLELYEGFTAQSMNHFMEVYYNKNIARFNEIYGGNAEAALRFTCLCNVLYFDGDYNAVIEQHKKEKKILKLIKKQNPENLSHYFRIDDVDQRKLSGYWVNASK